MNPRLNINLSCNNSCFQCLPRVCRVYLCGNRAVDSDITEEELEVVKKADSVAKRKIMERTNSNEASTEEYSEYSYYSD